LYCYYRYHLSEVRRKQNSSSNRSSRASTPLLEASLFSLDSSAGNNTTSQQESSISEISPFEYPLSNQNHSSRGEPRRISSASAALPKTNLQRISEERSSLTERSSLRELLRHGEEDRVTSPVSWRQHRIPSHSFSASSSSFRSSSASARYGQPARASTPVSEVSDSRSRMGAPSRTLTGKRSHLEYSDKPKVVPDRAALSDLDSRYSGTLEPSLLSASGEWSQDADPLALSVSHDVLNGNQTSSDTGDPRVSHSSIIRRICNVVNKFEAT